MNRKNNNLHRRVKNFSPGVSKFECCKVPKALVKIMVINKKNFIVTSSLNLHTQMIFSQVELHIVFRVIFSPEYFEYFFQTTLNTSCEYRSILNSFHQLNIIIIRYMCNYRKTKRILSE